MNGLQAFYEKLLSDRGLPDELPTPACDAMFMADPLPEEEPTEMDRAGIDPLTPVDTFIAMNGTTRYIGEIE